MQAGHRGDGCFKGKIDTGSVYRRGSSALEHAARTCPGCAEVEQSTRALLINAFQGLEIGDSEAYKTLDLLQVARDWHKYCQEPERWRPKDVALRSKTYGLLK
eukprot:1161255-Pelagomonas_calceolata.AAC.3